MPYWSGWIRIRHFQPWMSYKRWLEWCWSAMVCGWRASLGLHGPRALTSVSASTHCRYMASASLCSYSAPGLRWFLASNLETSAVWVCGMRGAGNLTTLKFTSKGRAPCACGAGGLRDAGSMVVWWLASPWYG